MKHNIYEVLLITVGINKWRIILFVLLRTSELRIRVIFNLQSIFVCLKCVEKLEPQIISLFQFGSKLTLPDIEIYCLLKRKELSKKSV